MQFCCPQDVDLGRSLVPIGEPQGSKLGGNLSFAYLLLALSKALNVSIVGEGIEQKAWPVLHVQACLGQSHARQRGLQCQGHSHRGEPPPAATQGVVCTRFPLS